MSMPMRPNLTTHAHDVFASAHDLADRLGHDDVTPVHVAISVVREIPNVGAGALFNLGVSPEVLERELEECLPPSETPRNPAPPRTWSATDEHFIEQAKVEAHELGTRFYGCEHVLLAFLRDEAGATAQVLARHGIGYDNLRAEILRMLST